MKQPKNEVENQEVPSKENDLDSGRENLHEYENEFKGMQ